MQWLRKHRSRWRQWRYAAEFRIDVRRYGDFDAALMSLVSEYQRALRQIASGGDSLPAIPREPPAGGEPPREEPATAPDDGNPLAVAICENHFRLRRNLAGLLAKVDDCKELRSIQRCLHRLEQVLSENGIEYADLTNQAYDVGRVDFEMIGEPEEMAGIGTPRITHCERPAVLVHGRLVQRARGIVAKPLRKTQPTEGTADGRN